MIRVVNDVGAPALVTLADLGTQAVAPAYNEYAAYILAAAGYIGAYMGYGGDFVKNVGIASFPWAARHLYAKAATKTAKVSRWPAPTTTPQFQGTRLV